MPVGLYASTNNSHPLLNNISSPQLILADNQPINGSNFNNRLENTNNNNNGAENFYKLAYSSSLNNLVLNGNNISGQMKNENFLIKSKPATNDTTSSALLSKSNFFNDLILTSDHDLNNMKLISTTNNNSLINNSSSNSFFGDNNKSKSDLINANEAKPVLIVVLTAPPQTQPPSSQLSSHLSSPLAEKSNLNGANFLITNNTNNNNNTVKNERSSTSDKNGKNVNSLNSILSLPVKQQQQQIEFRNSMAVNHNGNGRLSAKEPSTNKQPKQHINKMKFNKDDRPPTNHNQNCQIEYSSNGFLFKNEMNESQQQLVLSDLLFENTMASMVNGQQIIAAPSNIFSYPSPSSLSSSSSSLSSSSSSTSTSSLSSSPSSFLNSKKDNESPPLDTSLSKENDLKNNIDFAIDAVIDRCRQEQDQENEETTIKNESQTNEAIASSSMSCQKVDLPPSSPSSNNHPSVNMNGNLDLSDSCVAGSTIVQQQQQQPPMSKSSKARTSYISSLIANREKTSKDEEKKQIDDKQKRISQNILSILATVNTTNNNNNNNITNTNISPKKEPLPPLSHSSTHINTHTNISSTATSKSKQQASSSPKSKSITKEIQPLPAESKTAASLNELITMINNSTTTTSTTTPSKTNLNEKSFSLLEKAHKAANRETPIDFFINTSNAQIPKCEQTSQQERTVNVSVNKSFNSNNTITSEQSHSFLDCVNLKMLLSQPIEKRPVVGDAVATSGGCDGESQLDQRILETSFDSKLIRIEIAKNLSDKKKQQLENGNVTKKIVKKKRKTNPLDQSSLSDIASTIESVALAVADKNYEFSSPPQSQQQQQQVVEKSRKVNIIKRKATKREEDPKSLPPKQEPEKPVGMMTVVERYVEKLPTFKAKKLKTIADIVKHNSTQQFNTVVNQRLLQQQSSVSSSNSNHDSLASSTSSCSSSNSSSSSLSNFINSNLLQDFTTSNNNTNNLTVSWINNTLANNSLFSTLDNFYASENTNSNLIRTSNNMDAEINIDHLLEIELTANQQSPIDKYIDLDEIDVNPIEDCYRNTSHINNNSGGNTNNSTSTTNTNNNGVLQNTNNTNLDEFALQFSVCSSSSSGFSEPSSFSCSSSMSSTNSGFAVNNNNSNTNNLFSSSNTSESQSSPISYQSYDHHHSPSISSSSSTATTSSSTQSINGQKLSTNNLLMQQNNFKSNEAFLTNSDTNNSNIKNKNDESKSNSFKLTNQQPNNNLDWNLIEFNNTNNTHHNDVTKLGNLIHNHNHDLLEENHTEINTHFSSTHDLINDQPSSGNSNANNGYISNCGDNMFGSFNFFTDEIKLEI